MRVLLDSHVLLWWLADDDRLIRAHRDLITDVSNDVLVSAITTAEIAIKASLGKLDVPDDFEEVISAGGFERLPFTAEHASVLRRLPWHHRDPFDRMLVAQAVVEGIPLLSVDTRMRDYEVAVI
ncbi:type II toxin-antitoxin system VapC family toxin [Agromyces aureus]|uniref:Twitching motility protein PilT n=1 Tax=Agromyces aureus TaxID=453304 RepID=A0A191WIG9_9MICO|nr:type II toxin-antitoxin system VapC family toxin [Agromyces aureus]ANJ28110.1 twitching motility protein PilT [Agromyces aureus]